MLILYRHSLFLRISLEQALCSHILKSYQEHTDETWCHLNETYVQFEICRLMLTLHFALTGHFYLPLYFCLGSFSIIEVTIIQVQFNKSIINGFLFAFCLLAQKVQFYKSSKVMSIIPNFSSGKRNYLRKSIQKLHSGAFQAIFYHAKRLT